MSPATDRHPRDFFAELRDPRVTGRCDHELLDVVLIVVCGTIAGADDFVGIASWARSKEGWLRDRLGLRPPNGSLHSGPGGGRTALEFSPVAAFGGAEAAWIQNDSGLPQGRAHP